MTTAQLAHGLLGQLYKLDDEVNYHGELENIHFEILDGIGQNIIFLKLPGHEGLVSVREYYNEMWEKDGINNITFQDMFCFCEGILQDYLFPIEY